MEKRKQSFKYFRSSGIEEIVLHELSADERQDKRFLGSGYGTSVAHCLYLGQKYSSFDLLGTVKYYYIDTSEDKDLAELRKFQKNSIKVEFYGEGR